MTTAGLRTALQAAAIAILLGCGERASAAAPGEGGATVVEGVMRQVRKSPHPEQELLAAIEIVVNANPRDGRQLVRALLKDGSSPTVLVRVLELVGTERDDELVLMISRYTRHRSTSIRLAAIEALKRVGGASAGNALKNTLRNADAKTRAMAARALRSFRSHDALPDLISVFDKGTFEAAPAIGHICLPAECRAFSRRLGAVPLEYMEEAFDNMLLRPDSELPIEEKQFIVGLIRSVSTAESDTYLAEVAGRLPEATRDKLSLRARRSSR